MVDKIEKSCKSIAGKLVWMQHDLLLLYSEDECEADKLIRLSRIQNALLSITNSVAEIRSMSVEDILFDDGEDEDLMF